LSPNNDQAAPTIKTESGQKIAEIFWGSFPEVRSGFLSFLEEPHLKGEFASCSAPRQRRQGAFRSERFHHSEADTRWAIHLVGNCFRVAEKGQAFIAEMFAVMAAELTALAYLTAGAPVSGCALVQAHTFLRN
jgi:hypothetical protein